MEDMLDNIDFEVLLQAVAHSAKTVYAYEACGVQDCSFNYRSAPLFPQKAVRLYEDIVKFVTEAVICARTMEVWLLEDLTLAIVSNYSVLSGGEFTTEYRTVKAWEFQKDFSASSQIRLRRNSWSCARRFTRTTIRPIMSCDRFFLRHQRYRKRS